MAKKSSLNFKKARQKEKAAESQISFFSNNSIVKAKDMVQIKVYRDGTTLECGGCE